MEYSNNIFKPGKRRPQAGTPLALKIISVQTSVFVHVCVSASKAIN